MREKLNQVKLKITLVLVMLFVSGFFAVPIGLYVLSLIPFSGIEIKSFFSAFLFGGALYGWNLLRSLLAMGMKEIFMIEFKTEDVFPSIWMHAVYSIVTKYAKFWVLDSFLPSVSFSWITTLFCAIIIGILPILLRMKQEKNRSDATPTK